jgi:predicted CopG family antitoxin
MLTERPMTSMNGKDLKTTAVANEVYSYLAEMCQSSGVELSDLIHELASKQQLIDIRMAVAEGWVEVPN